MKLPPHLRGLVLGRGNWRTRGPLLPGFSAVRQVGWVLSAVSVVKYITSPSNKIASFSPRKQSPPCLLSFLIFLLSNNCLPILREGDISESCSRGQNDSPFCSLSLFPPSAISEDQCRVGVEADWTLGCPVELYWKQSRPLLGFGHSPSTDAGHAQWAGTPSQEDNGHQSPSGP